MGDFVEIVRKWIKTERDLIKKEGT